MVADPQVAEINRAARPGDVLTRDVPMTGSPRFISFSGLYGDNFDRYTNPDSIPFETYNQMRQTGMIRAGLILIKAPILAALTKATVECEDPKIKRVVEAQFLENGLLYRLGKTALNAIDFGVAIHEKVWDVEDLYLTYAEKDDDTGESFDEIAWNGPCLVYREFRDVNPMTVLYLLRDPKTRAFAGFVQQYAPTWLSTGEQTPQPKPMAIPGASKQETVDGIPVPAAKAFVYTHNKEFGNLWGEPRDRPSYGPFFWSNVIQKYWMAWAERKLIPTRAIRHPVGRDADGNDYGDIAIAIGNAIDDVSNVAVPNTRVREAGSQAGGDYLWAFEEIQTTDKAETFKLIKDDLDIQMLRGMFVPERTFTQGQGFGLFSTDAQAHTDVFLMTEDAEAIDLLDAVNQDAVKPFVIANFGSSAPKATIHTPGLTDEHKEMLREIVMQILANPAVLSQIDIRAVLEQNDIPLSDEDKQALDAATLAAGGTPTLPPVGTEQESDAEAAAGTESGAAEAGAGSGAAQGAGDAAEPVPGNLILQDEAIALAFDDTRWSVTADPKALNGYKVIDNNTGKRISGYAAQQVVESFLKAQRGAEKSAGKKAQSDAIRAQKKAAADAVREQKKAIAAAAKVQRQADAAAKKAAREAVAAKNKADRLQTAAAKKAAHDALVKQHHAETDAKAKAREADRLAKANARDQAKQEKASASASSALNHQQTASVKAEKSLLEGQTSKQDANGATQTVKAAGYSVEGQPAGDLGTAVSNAENVARQHPDRVVTVVKTAGGGALVVSKAKTAINIGQPNASNVALEEPDLTRLVDLSTVSTQLADTGGHAAPELPDSFVVSAAKRLFRHLRKR